MHGAGCAAIVPGAFSASCVGDSGSDGVYPRGGGSVFVINDMGGAHPYAVSAGAPEAGYFASTMTTATWGLTRVAVTRDRLDVGFVPAGGSYTDAFAITAP